MRLNRWTVQVKTQGYSREDVRVFTVVVQADNKDSASKAFWDLYNGCTINGRHISDVMNIEPFNGHTELLFCCNHYTPKELITRSYCDTAQAHNALLKEYEETLQDDNLTRKEQVSKLSRLDDKITKLNEAYKILEKLHQEG